MLNAAAPIGPSIIICFGDAILSGKGAFCLGMLPSSRLRFDTLNPTRPVFGLAPEPVAPSSLISPPEPVAAPGKGEIAVG